MLGGLLLCPVGQGKRVIHDAEIALQLPALCNVSSQNSYSSNPWVGTVLRAISLTRRLRPTAISHMADLACRRPAQ